MTSRTVGNYKLVEKLGEGGMGAVYKGVDLMVERAVAVKMLRPEIARRPEIVERFRAEAVALAKLNHPNIATLYSFFREGDEYFMVMEFVQGPTLESIIRNSALRIEQAVAISSQVLDAIEHAHSYGILHRDIKPANIMLTGSGQAKVTDFGIARVLGTARMTREGSICGTLQYLAPERIRGQEADLRSDLYSMGVVVYEMLSGHLPFERDNEYDLMRAHLEESPPPFASFGLTSILQNLEVVVAKALVKRPEERFATAGEFRSALAGAQWNPSVEPTWPAAEPSRFAGPAPVAIQAPTTVPDVSPSVSPTAFSGTLRWKVGAGVAAVLILIGLILAFSWSRKPEAVEATRPAPAPAAAQPATPTVQPQAVGEVGAGPAAAGSQAGADTQPVPDNVSPAQPEFAAPTSDAAKMKSAAKSTPEERRKAALKALGKDPGTAPKAAKNTEKDRRASSLDALKR